MLINIYYMMMFYIINVNYTKGRSPYYMMMFYKYTKLIDKEYLFYDTQYIFDINIYYMNYMNYNKKFVIITLHFLDILHIIIYIYITQ